jgi:hypothetical protein
MIRAAINPMQPTATRAGARLSVADLFRSAEENEQG